MTNSLTLTARGTRTASFAAALTIAAIIASMTGAKTAKAWDQQATEAQMSTELSHHATGGHDLVPLDYPSGAYASVDSYHRGIRSGVSVPLPDFQLEGR
jgi:hypothetical protein